MGYPGFFLERRRFRFYDSEFTFVVPHRMLLSTKRGGGQGSAVVAILFDETTGAFMYVDRDGRVVLETFWDAETNSYRAVHSRSGGIYKSWRGVPPPPGHDLRALWDEIEQSIRREPLP